MQIIEFHFILCCIEQFFISNHFVNWNRTDQMKAKRWKEIASFVVQPLGECTRASSSSSNDHSERTRKKKLWKYVPNQLVIRRKLTTKWRMKTRRRKTNERKEKRDQRWTEEKHWRAINYSNELFVRWSRDDRRRDERRLTMKTEKKERERNNQTLHFYVFLLLFVFVCLIFIVFVVVKHEKIKLCSSHQTHFSDFIYFRFTILLNNFSDASFKVVRKCFHQIEWNWWWQKWNSYRRMKWIKQANKLVFVII